MHECVLKTFSAVRKTIDPNKRRFCFELFGYDFILDEDFNSFLIEVNTNPCLEESSALLKALLPRMIEDMLKLTIDQTFPKSSIRRRAAPTPSTTQAFAPDLGNNTHHSKHSKHSPSKVRPQSSIKKGKKSLGLSSSLAQSKATTVHDLGEDSKSVEGGNGASSEIILPPPKTSESVT